MWKIKKKLRMWKRNHIANLCAEKNSKVLKNSMKFNLNTYWLQAIVSMQKSGRISLFFVHGKRKPIIKRRKFVALNDKSTHKKITAN
jgi:hypothetical protein